MSLAYSEALKQNKFLRPPSDKSTTQRENAQDSDSDWDSRSASPSKIVRFKEPSQKKKPRRRQANLYDAVAGKYLPHKPLRVPFGQMRTTVLMYRQAVLRHEDSFQTHSLPPRPITQMLDSWGLAFVAPKSFSFGKITP